MTTHSFRKLELEVISFYVEDAEENSHPSSPALGEEFFFYFSSFLFTIFVSII